MTPIQEIYHKEALPALMEEFKYRNVMQVPKVTKIVLSMGVGEAIQNMKTLDNSMKELGIICGQKPKMTRAKKSISNFKLRQNMPIGCCVTLRRERMYEFYERFIKISVPNIRDFRGFPKNGFDGRGNYSLGIKEHIIFPEIEYDKIEKITGMNINFVTTAETDQEALKLLILLGFPFRK